jgi:hypothetical protein
MVKSMSDLYTGALSMFPAPKNLENLFDECRTMYGIEPDNIEEYGDHISFTITTEITEQTPEDFFNMVCEDLNRWVGGSTNVDEIFCESELDDEEYADD